MSGLIFKPSKALRKGTTYRKVSLQETLSQQAKESEIEIDIRSSKPESQFSFFAELGEDSLVFNHFLPKH